MPEFQRILVLLPNPLGDALMATPAIAALRQRYPAAHIALAGKGLVVKTLFCEELADESIVLSGFWSTAKQLRTQQFDLAVICPGSFRSAALAWFGRCKRRLGYRRDGRGLLLTDRLDIPINSDGTKKVYPALDYYLDLVAAVDAPAQSRDLILHAAPADALLAEAGYDPARPLVLLNPGGAFGPSKLWPMERYAQLAEQLIETHNAQIIINAAPNEQTAIAAVTRAMTHTPLLDFSARANTLDALTSLVAACDLVVTNDTGTRHIAAALGTPLVTIFGSTDPAWTTLDCPREITIVTDADCAPCQKKSCPIDPASDTFHQCMTTISVETVFAAANELLAGGVR